MRTEKLIVFVRAPRPGTVKTRLAQALGAERACAAYRRLAEELFSRLSTLEQVELRFAPDDARAEIKQWQRDSWELQPQGEGDLGQRLRAAFAQAFTNGARRVVIIGSDCPAVSVQDIQDAWAALRTSDVVLGPARDGGYWLIGLRQPRTGLFDAVAWGTEAVLSQTLRAAQAAGLKVRLLRELYDVDTEPDWQEFLATH